MTRLFCTWPGRASGDHRLHGRQPIWAAEPLERRLLLSVQHLPFLAANYSSEDPGFALQAASAARRELVFDPGEYAPDDAPHYDPAWFGFSLFAMPDKDMFRPDTDAAGHVQSSMSVEAARDQLPGDDTLANYWKYRAQSYSAFTLERRGPATLKWKITQGVWAGRELTLKGETSRFRFVEFSTDSIQDED